MSWQKEKEKIVRWFARWSVNSHYIWNFEEELHCNNNNRKKLFNMYLLKFWDSRFHFNYDSNYMLQEKFFILYFFLESVYVHIYFSFLPLEERANTWKYFFQYCRDRYVTFLTRMITEYVIHSCLPLKLRRNASQDSRIQRKQNFRKSSSSFYSLKRDLCMKKVRPIQKNYRIDARNNTWELFEQILVHRIRWFLYSNFALQDRSNLQTK